jgi:hypothetical protein
MLIYQPFWNTFTFEFEIVGHLLLSEKTFAIASPKGPEQPPSDTDR